MQMLIDLSCSFMFLDFGAPALLQLVSPSISSTPSRLSHHGPSHEEVRDEEHEGNEDCDESSSDEEEGSEQDCSRKGSKEKTASGFSKADLLKNKRNKVVTKKQHAAGKKAYKNISAWTIAVTKARKELGIKGFCAVNGKTAQGKALYAKAKAIYAA